MSATFTWHGSLLGSQSVEHVTYGCITAPGTRNIVIVRGDLLQIYEVASRKLGSGDSAHESAQEASRREPGSDNEVQQDGVQANKQASGDKSGTREALLLVSELYLSGYVAGMDVIHPSSSHDDGRDKLVLVFRDAKMSILEWSEPQNSLITVSIHYYEREEFKLDLLGNPYPPIVRVDHQSRCCVLNFYGRKLAILPFREEDILDTQAMESTEDIHKYPYAPSFVIDVHDLDDQAETIIDMTFLHEYSEPTLAVLFKPASSWPGRGLQVGMEAAVIVVSLDLTSRAYPVIFKYENLPSESLQITSIPKMGGILVNSANALIHLSQGASPVGYALNAYAKATTKLALDDMYSALELRLEGAQLCMLTEQMLLIITRAGQWCTAKFTFEGRKIVALDLEILPNSRFSDITKTASERLHPPNVALPYHAGGVIPSGIVAIDTSELIFVGCRTGDSMLVKISSGGAEDLRVTDGVTQPIIGQKRKASVHDIDFDLYGTNLETDEDDMPAANGNSNHVSQDIGSKPYLTICDKICGAAPVLDMALGVSQNRDKEHRDSQMQVAELELVTCAGIGSDACLNVFKQQIQPVNQFTFDFSGATDGYAIAGPQSQDASNTINGSAGASSNTYDRFVVISSKERTMVLEAGDELHEIEDKDFELHHPTFAAGAIFNGNCIMQAYSRGIKLFDNEGKMKQFVNVDDEDNPIIAASISEPFVLLQHMDGKLHIYKCSEAYELSVMEMPVTFNALPAISATLYADTDLLLAEMHAKSKNANGVQRDTGSKRRRLSRNTKTYSASNGVYAAGNVDDNDDADLYGNTRQYNATNETPHIQRALGSTQQNGFIGQPAQEPTAKGFGVTCAVLRTSGALEFFDLENQERIFNCRRFSSCPSILAHDQDDDDVSNTSEQNSGNDIQEIALVAIGNNFKHLHLIALTQSSNVLLYRAFSISSKSGPECSKLGIRFQRQLLPIVTVEIDGQSTEAAYSVRRRRLVPMCLDGHASLAILTKKPLLVIGGRSFARVFPISTSHSVTALTPFHNVNCQHGLILFDDQGAASCNTLPHLNDSEIEANMLSTRFTLEQKSVHKIVYHEAMQVYAVLISTSENFIMRDEDGEPTIPEDIPEGRFLPVVERYQLVLVSPITWEIVDRFNFEEAEQGLALACVSLESKATASGRKDFIVVGTGYGRGEDVAMRGSVYILDIIEVVPEIDNPQSNHKFKLRHTEEVRGGVTAVCGIKGYLVTCTGPKLFVRSFEDNESLVSIAFMDLRIYVTSITSVKNMLLIGDAYQSISFVVFQEEPPKLITLGKDYQSLEIQCVDWVMDDRSLTFVVADTEGNLELLQYAPYNLQSVGGQRLMRRGEFHIGSQIQKFLRLPSRQLDGSVRQQTQLCLMAAIDGRLDYVIPLAEKRFKRLSSLYNQLVNSIQHPAGLNPRAFRQPPPSRNHPPHIPFAPRNRSVLDGRLITLFLSQPPSVQRDMCKSIGSTVKTVMEDLRVIQTAVAWL
ncbi:hypothetical protein BZG36_04828 [Bifiguratus adelaidae]|uniref:DNA damage-binding protein 1 n=1 Tax=Bifiguratus adelaidae TaxID=1938954 RepID=A0A261XVP3_9FUNG|nr:hypothetical protein BZG36_04828 [Bifiguratus adelaidae]